jgi:hypothetical protein
MRDESLEVPAPCKLKPDLKYHRTELRKAKAELKKISKFTPKQIERFNKKAHIKDLADKKRWLDDTIAEQKILDNMMVQVNTWNAPLGFEEFKGFMRNQLEISKTSVEYRQNEYDKTVANTHHNYWADTVESVKWSVKYHTEGIEKEISHTNKANEWLKTLHTSLPKK